MAAAIAVGILVGMLSGVVLLLLVRTASRATIDNVPSVVTITGQLLAIPGFVFGGAFLKDKLLSTLPTDAYVISLAVTFVLFVLPVLYGWLFRLARELGRDT